MLFRSFQHRGHDISSSGERSYHRAGVSPYALLSPLRSCQSCRKPPFPSARAWAWSVFLFRFSSAAARCLKSLDLRNGAAHLPPPARLFKLVSRSLKTQVELLSFQFPALLAQLIVGFYLEVSILVHLKIGSAHV